MNPTSIDADKIPDAFAENLRDAVAQANIPTLLLLVVHLTGELKWLEEPYRPSQTKGLGNNDTGGLDPALQDDIRQRAMSAILDWKAGNLAAIAAPSKELLVRMLGVSMGEPVPIGYADMILHELGADAGGTMSKVPDMRQEIPEGFRAIIVGAGASGLCAAVNFHKAGIPFTIFERNTEIGGVWHENHYPGAGVDTPSHLYCFSFARNNWSRYFAAQSELKAYFTRVAEEFDLVRHIQFGVEVTGAAFDETTGLWQVELRHGDGQTEFTESNLLVSAVGAFNKPKWPNIPGLDQFLGPVVHTARWDDTLDLNGKRVAVIGNGASSMQLVPAVVDKVKEMVVFQRSPQWAAPFEQFKTDIPNSVRWLFENVQLYEKWYRIRLAWIFNDRIYESLQKDPNWEHPERSINAINDAHRRYFTRYIESEIGDRTDLLKKVLPTYPPFGKRMLLDNGWFRTMARDNVTLVTDTISQITETGIETKTGDQFDVDVIVIATGFDVVRFLAPMRIVGRDGQVLEDVWKGDDARAYLGALVPGFPNFFCLYGPNTQFGHGGSLIFMLELQMHYLMSLIEQMVDHGVASVECRQEVHDAYNAKVDAAHENMVWTHQGMDVYYRNSRGRVVVNNPFKIVDYWQLVQKANLDEYEIGRHAATDTESSLNSEENV